MSLTLAEGLIDSLNTYIAANITAKLAALDAEYTDSIVLRAPVATYIGIKTVRAIQDYPAMFIFAPEQRIEVRQHPSVASKPVVFMGMVEIEQDSEALQRRLYRYGRAFVDLMIAAAAPGSTALGGWVLDTSDEWQAETTTGLFTETRESDFVDDVWLRVRAYAWEE